MISISINGRDLAIPSDTSITMEQSAAWADLDNISSDVVWTFTVPAEPNARILDCANYVVVSQRKRYDCVMSFCGIPKAKGQLYIQQCDDEQQLSCGMTFNAFGPGWGGKKLSDVDSDDDIVIATSINTHQQEWLDFLRGTLDADSVVKFFPFIDSSFYSSNEDYGYHNGHLAPLENRDSEDVETNIINRLFTDEGGEIINLDETLDGAPNYQGLQIFNKYIADEKKNGYAFTPAIRLDHIINMVLPSMLRARGTFMSNIIVTSLFMQSMSALDDDVFQYDLYNYFLLGRGLVPGSSTPALAPLINVTFNDDSDYTSFRIASRQTIPTASFRVTPDLTDLQSDVIVTDIFFDAYDECYMLAFCASHTSMPQWMYRLPSDGVDPRYYGAIRSVAELVELTGETFEDPHVEYVRYDSGQKRWYASVYDGSIYTTHEYPISSPIRSEQWFFIQLTDTATLFADYTDSLTHSYLQGGLTLDQLRIYGSEETHWSVALVKARVYRSSDGAGQYPGPGVSTLRNAPLEMVTIDSILDTSQVVPADNALNIYSNRLRWEEHLPNMTKGEFLKALCQMFGLTLWAGEMDGTVQLDYFADIYKAGDMAIDDIVVSTRKTTYDPAHYKLTVSSVSEGSDVSERMVLPEVQTREQLPRAQINKGRHVLVSNENAYRTSVKDEDTDTYTWQQGGGSNSALHVGDKDIEEEEVSSAFKVPNMAIADEAHTPKYMLQIESTGCSPLFDKDYNGKFDPILLQYRGRKKINLQSAAAYGRPSYTAEAYIEVANPTRFNADGTVEDGFINLTATGEQSVGEMWQRPLYEFLANSQEVEFGVILNASQFLLVQTLMRPQDGPIAKQTRWLSYKSQKYLPTKIVYEFGRGDTVKATITARRRIYE